MKVYIVYGSLAYADMWVSNGHEVVSGWAGADIVQFTGGHDVSSSFYNQHKHPTSQCSLARDQAEKIIFDACAAAGIPMTGICRGGQFLNVMCGGSLYQNVDGHAVGGTHLATDVVTGDIYDVSSTHHQMMRVGAWGEVVGIARESSFRAYMSELESTEAEVIDYAELADTEVVVYEDSKVLCFQPHPEFFDEDHECQVWYFDLLERYLGVK